MSQPRPLEDTALHPSPTVIEGTRVRLEPVNSSRHAEPLYRHIKNSPDLWLYLFEHPPADLAAFQQLLARRESFDTSCFYAIIEKASGDTVGLASYLRIEPVHRVIEVGNLLFSPKLQRTAAATEAMYLMARHAFEDLGYRRYEWKCNARNMPSRKAALRLGFTFEGIFRQHMIIKGESRDTAWFALLDTEWPSRKAALERWLSPANFDEQHRQRRSLSSFLNAAP